MVMLPLEHEPIMGTEHVYLNGVEQFRPQDWTLFRSTTGVVHVVTQEAMDARPGDLLECRYAWMPGYVSPDAKDNPYSAGNPATQGAVAGEYVGKWPYLCSGSNKYWEPTGYVPPGYATLTQGPNNSLQQPRFVDPTVNSSYMWLTAGGFGTGVADFRWYYHEKGTTGLGDNFGDLRIFFLKPDGCVWSGDVYSAQNYSSPGFQVVGTVTAGGRIIRDGFDLGAGPPAGSIFIRTIRNYRAQASWFITHDVGYNPSL